MVPKAIRVAVLLNPASAAAAETTLREVQEAARVIGLQIQILNPSTSREIEAAFATIARERPDALFVAPDSFFRSRRVQFATLAARDRIPAAYGQRDYVAAGGPDELRNQRRRTCFVKSVPMSAAFSMARRRPTCRCSSPLRFEMVLNLQDREDARPQGADIDPAAGAPTRSSNEDATARIHRGPGRRGGGSRVRTVGRFLHARSSASGRGGSACCWDGRKASRKSMCGWTPSRGNCRGLAGRKTATYEWTCAGPITRSIVPGYWRESWSKSRPDAIFCATTPATAALQRETRSIPIIFIASNPVGSGFVASLPTPGGNITGFASSTARSRASGCK